MPAVTEAMLLAAGLSTRTRPLTTTVPKALLPFWHLQCLDLSLTYLKSGGIRTVAVNAHHGRGALVEALAQRKEFQTHTFLEEPIILGSGGGIKNMRLHITTETFVVINCDFLCDLDLKEAIAFHEKQGALATMVLIDSQEKRRYGSIGVSKAGNIVDFPYGKPPRGADATGFFSGIHIFNRAIFDHMPDEPVFCINQEVYAPLVEKRAPVFGFRTFARWYDLGEISPYVRAQFDLLRQPFGWMKPFLADFERDKTGNWIHPSAQLATNARLKGNCLVSPGAIIGLTASLGPSVIVGPNAQIGDSARVERSLLYPSTRVEPNSELRDQLLLPDGTLLAVRTA